jgi:hypothetical protein
MEGNIFKHPVALIYISYTIYSVNNTTISTFTSPHYIFRPQTAIFRYLAHDDGRMRPKRVVRRRSKNGNSCIVEWIYCVWKIWRQRIYEKLLVGTVNKRRVHLLRSMQWQAFQHVLYRTLNTAAAYSLPLSVVLVQVQQQTGCVCVHKYTSTYATITYVMITKPHLVHTAMCL